MPKEVCALGYPVGTKAYISADCGKPRPEIMCDKYKCCDACYLDSQRDQEKKMGGYAPPEEDESNDDDEDDDDNRRFRGRTK